MTTPAVKQIILKQTREKSLLRHHPWVFSGAIQHVDGEPKPGETVHVYSATKQFLGCGAYSPSSQIRVRLWSFDQIEIDQAFFTARIKRANAKRDAFKLSQQSDAYRLIAAESDGLPGLIVDRYGKFLICQFVGVSAEVFKAEIVEALKLLDGIIGIYERSDVDVRKKEGLQKSTGVLWGEMPPELITIEENGIKFAVDVQNGHKTGFYLDQRENRAHVRGLSKDAEVLNCFAYTGGFGLAALAGDAKHVTNIEDVDAMVKMIDRNVALNEFDPVRSTNLKGNVFKVLREYEAEKRQFDLIILDPPKFADSQNRMKGACRGYQDINRLAIACLRPGGMLFTFSCSGLMKLDLFQKIVADAAIDAGRQAQLVQWLGQAPDHAIDMAIPESLYLKGLLVRVGE